VQFYFGLPIAMVILGVTLVPFLHGARVFTAYEFLERRFNPQTRSLTSFLFLLSRGMSAGTIIAAPAVVFSAIFGWDLIWSVALIGVPTVIYPLIGGVQAVTWADATMGWKTPRGEFDPGLFTVRAATRSMSLGHAARQSGVRASPQRSG
jgi:Na+/proline symporter